MLDSFCRRSVFIVALLRAALLPAQAGVLRGTVVDDSTNAPVHGAEVLIDGGVAKATTDEAGRFAFSGVAMGSHVLTIRRLGYSPLTTEVDVGTSGADLEFGLVRSVQLLAEMVVRDSVRPLERGKLSDFYRRQQGGIGTFLTSESFDQMGARRNAEILQARLPGARIIRAPCHSGAYVATSRFSGRLGGGSTNAVVCGQRMRSNICLAAVILDGIAVYRGMEGEAPFDVNSLQPGEIAAVEYYSSAAQIPVEYKFTANTCAVISVWTK